MKKLVSMLLVLCLVTGTVTVVAFADDSNTVTYEITDEHMVLLEKFKNDPSSVSFDELSQAMNDDIVFAAEAYKVLDSISVCLDDADVDYSIDDDSDFIVPYSVGESVPDLCMHDFQTGETYSGVVEHGIGTQSLDSNEYYPSRINRYNWTEGMCRIFSTFDNTHFGWASGFRVGPHWVMTCAHAFYSLVDLHYKSEDEYGNIFEEYVVCNHRFANSVIVVPNYIGGLPDTEMNSTAKITLTVKNAPLDYSVVDISKSYICEDYMNLPSSAKDHADQTVNCDWGFLYLDETYNPTSYFELHSFEEFLKNDYSGKKYYMSGYPGNRGEGTPLEDRALTQIECEYLRRYGRAGYFNEAVIGGMSGGPLLNVNYQAYGLNCRYDITQLGDIVGVCCMFNQLLLDQFNAYRVLGT